MMPRDAESETQWKVTWFPPDQDEVTRTGNERAVKKTAQLKDDWNPIIEKREIVVGPWEIVENKALDEKTGPSEADG